MNNIAFDTSQPLEFDNKHTRFKEVGRFKPQPIGEDS